VDPAARQLSAWQLSGDGSVLTVECANLRAGYVHEFELPEIVAQDGTPLWHRLMAYTLNQIP
jgi:hypothetical protein